jgi:hypothetical protein
MDVTGLFQGIEGAQTSRNRNRVEESQKRIVDLTQQISKAEINLHHMQDFKTPSADWTKAYQYWDKWEDIDELKASKINENDQLQKYVDENDMLGHCSDHTEVLTKHVFSK